jgi:hypothetical protein
MPYWLYIIFCLVGLAILIAFAVGAYRFCVRRRAEDAALLEAGRTTYGNTIPPNRVPATSDESNIEAAYRV